MRHKLMLIGTFLISILVCLSSCSNDGKNSDSPDDPTISKNSEASKFVGYWEGTKYHNGDKWGYAKFVFFDNGRCLIYYYDSYNDGSRFHSGYWEYDETNRFLGTTTEGVQCSISVLNNNSWSGIDMTSQKSYEMKKCKNSELFARLAENDYILDANGKNIIKVCHVNPYQYEVKWKFDADENVIYIGNYDKYTKKYIDVVRIEIQNLFSPKNFRAYAEVAPDEKVELHYSEEFYNILVGASDNGIFFDYDKHRDTQD